MSAIMTTWPVLQEHPVAAADLDADQTVADQAVARWVAAACQAYLDRCVALQRARERADLDLHRDVTLPPGAPLGRPTSVVVSAGATEVPSSFTIAVRLRPVGADREVAANATCVVRLQDRATGELVPIGDELRDELIAIQRSAQHYN
jgi:acyl-CoA thioesterase FadM